MKRKHYEKPSLEVVVLQQQAHLLAGSDGRGTVGTQNYKWNEEVEE